MRKETYVGNETIAAGKSIPLGEIGKAEGIEPTGANEIAKSAIELEAFMAEPVKIMVMASGVDGELDVITPSVNGINQPIIRGEEITVKRKFVEALARCRTTKYKQVIDPIDRSNIQMKEVTVVTYPFTILEDRNPKGPSWIKAILAER